MADLTDPQRDAARATYRRTLTRRLTIFAVILAPIGLLALVGTTWFAGSYRSECTAGTCVIDHPVGFAAIAAVVAIILTAVAASIVLGWRGIARAWLLSFGVAALAAGAAVVLTGVVGLLTGSAGSAPSPTWFVAWILPFVGGAALLVLRAIGTRGGGGRSDAPRPRP